MFFTEFTDKNICHASKRVRTCHLLCWRHRVRDRSFKLTPIHASVIYPISWIHWIHIHLGKTRLCLLLFFLLLVIFSLVVQEVRTADEVKILLNCSIVLVAKIIYFYDAMFQLLSRKDLNKLVNASRSVVFCCIWDFYCPPTKLREGNVFSRVCPSFCSHGVLLCRAMAPLLPPPHHVQLGLSTQGPPSACSKLINLDLTLQGTSESPPPTCSLWSMGC